MMLSIEQVARGLNLPLRTLKRWIRQGKIPVDRSASGYAFELEVIRRWAASHQLDFSHEPAQQADHASPAPVQLLTAMQRGKIYRDIEGSCLDDVLADAVDRIEFLDSTQKRQLFDKLLEREQLMSTGVGKGFAIPHPRTPLTFGISDAFIATCFLKQAVDFNAIDDLPVSVMFVLWSPTVKTHLHLLSKLSFCLRDDAFGAYVFSRPDDDALFGRIADMEKNMDHS